MLHMFLFLLFTMPLIYRVLLALFDPQRLHEQESAQVIHMIEQNMGPLLHDPLLSQIGGELAKEQNITAEFYLVSSDLVNAVALPNGTILIWQGLLARIRRDEDKVAAVLAHEISHLYHDHHLRRLYWMVLLQFSLGFLSKGFLNSVFKQISFRTLFSGYSRFHERQADDTALDIMIESRFDPYKMLQLFTDFEHLETVHYNFFSSHPSPTQRKLRILKKLQQRKKHDRDMNSDTSITNKTVNIQDVTSIDSDTTDSHQDNSDLEKDHLHDNETNTENVTGSNIPSPTLSNRQTTKQRSNLPKNVIPFPKRRRKNRRKNR
jgi:predicted Zn-dependent protease